MMDPLFDLTGRRALVYITVGASLGAATGAAIGHLTGGHGTGWPVLTAGGLVGGLGMFVLLRRWWGNRPAGRAAALVGGLGWQFGNALQWWLGDLRSIEEALLVGVLLAGLAYSAWRWTRGRRRR